MCLEYCFLDGMVQIFPLPGVSVGICAGEDAVGRHSEIAVEVGKAKLRITGAPDPQTLQLVLQQLVR